MIKIRDASSREQKPQSADRHKEVEWNICLCKIRSDTQKHHMPKHRDLHTSDEEEIHDEIKGRMKL